MEHPGPGEEELGQARLRILRPALRPDPDALVQQPGYSKKIHIIFATLKETVHRLRYCARIDDGDPPAPKCMAASDMVVPPHSSRLVGVLPVAGGGRRWRRGCCPYGQLPRRAGQHADFHNLCRWCGAVAVLCEPALLRNGPGAG
eukprot:scaffold830_cov112-Isochrysis_galbana.AAC.1